MTIEVARYQFHSWARRGIAANITDADDLGTGTVHTVERAQVPVDLKANAQPVTKRFSLVGPGDVVGINREMVVRTEPLHWITDFEPNYLAFIEFYDEDFAWRYTPAAAAAGEKLRPWLALLVLEEDEFERTARQLPLPSITIRDKTAMPAAGELWLWAHVHSNADIPDADLSDYERFLNSLNTSVDTDPDGLFCRLMSPRHLKPNTPYHAFVVPTFETGRLAGIGEPTAGVEAQRPSWQADGTPGGEMPVYYEWFFRTGANEDFESLVRLLEPRAMDPRVGIRDMDCSAPGFVTADGSGPLPATSPPILGLEGALKSPSAVSTVFPSPPAHDEFREALEAVVNLGETAAADPTQDPIVTLPLYGKNHARQNPADTILLDHESQRWLDDLNRDPRTRTFAGVGTRVIQKNQERYMRAAWLQVDRILEANRRIRDAKAAIAFATPLFARSFAARPTVTLLAMSRPVLAKVMGSPTTLHHQLMESRLPAAALSGTFRRLLRPGGPFARRLGIDAGAYEGVVVALNDGTLTAAPPRTPPGGLPTTQGLGDGARPTGSGAWLARYGWILLIVLLLLLLILLFLALSAGAAAAAVAIAVAGVAAAVAIVRAMRRAQRRQEVADVLGAPETAGDTIASVPPRPGFTVRLEGEATVPAATSGGAGGESVEAERFRAAVTGISRIASVHPAAQPERQAFALEPAKAKVVAALEPRRAHGVRLSKRVRIRNLHWTEPDEPIVEAMAYPEFDEPMYRKLNAESGDFLLPNLKLVPPNTISLLETNQKAIESYMVGLNHEMGRELLWREYPTDQRGSYFRQFWDVSGLVQPDSGKTAAQLAEEHKDIPPIHTWQRHTRLGRHNQRDAQGDAEQVVLVIRGDLLKRYPNSVIFAQKAEMNSLVERVIDLDLTASEFGKELLFPLYRADIYPDLKFFGFDLTVRQARGDDPSPGFPDDDDFGWFFVIQEVPGEPRFGMDISFDAGTDGVTWDDLSWRSFPTPDPDFVRVSPHPTGFTPTDNTPDRWARSSAEMAYVLFQKPSMVAVHASEMLANLA